MPCFIHGNLNAKTTSLVAPIQGIGATHSNMAVMPKATTPITITEKQENKVITNATESLAGPGNVSPITTAAPSEEEIDKVIVNGEHKNNKTDEESTRSLRSINLSKDKKATKTGVSFLGSEPTEFQPIGDNIKRTSADVKNSIQTTDKKLTRVGKGVAKEYSNQTTSAVLIAAAPHIDTESNGIALDYTQNQLSLQHALPWYAHSELELAMIRVRGCLGPSFFEAYHSILPREHVYEYRQRL